MTGTTPDRWLATVVLRHDGPDGAHHFDWLIAKRSDLSDPEERALLTFRCPAIPGESDAIDAERIDDHRVHYLTHEGPIGGGRGSVQRVLEGHCRVVSISDRAFTMDLSLGAKSLTVSGEMHEGTAGDRELWRIAFKSAEPPA